MSSEPTTTTRRSFLGLIGGLLVAPAFLVQGVLSFLRSMWPNALYEPPKAFKIGPPGNFTEGVTMLADQRIFVIRKGNDFHVISAVCEHLGCTVAKVDVPEATLETSFKGVDHEFTQTYEFHCACHGSKYRGDGTRYAGPAPRPLKWHELEAAPDGDLIVNTATDLTHDYTFQPQTA